MDPAIDDQDEDGRSVQIEQVLTVPIEPAYSDPSSEDEFLAESVGSDFGSVTSSVYANTYERGRRYQAYKNSRYPIPNDDREQNREDMKHAMIMELTDGTLFYSPIGTHPQKIVDIGTGTGKFGSLCIIKKKPSLT